jgi:N-acyl-D-aspartate/D-glutamate deacylase
MKHIKEKDMLLALVHPDIIVGSDGMVYMDKDGQLLPADADFGAGQGHPRGAGSYGSYLRMAIDDASLSMPQILAKTSYLPARLVERVAPSMKKRGRLQVNAYADITLFDPEKVEGVAGYQPGTNSLPSKGFVYVLVNGKTVVKEGVLVDGVFPGEPIRGEVAKAP